MFNQQGNPYINTYNNYRQPQAPTQYGYTPMAGAPQQTTLIQVTGLEGAKAYPLAPNSTAALFDGERDIFYIKRTDAGGYPSLQAYQFAPVQEATTPQPDYVTRQEFEELKEALLNGKQSVPAEPAK